ncbi:Carboxypeptidase N subunit 2, partial [Stegodyphus mimosarum]
MFLHFILVLLFFRETPAASKAACELYQLKENVGTYVKCYGDFITSESLKTNLSLITEPISTFELNSVTLEALPDDLFGNVEAEAMTTLIFDHVSLDLLSVPGYDPFKEIEHTLQKFEIYDSASVFAWNVTLLSSVQSLETFIVENSEVISLSQEFNFWSNLTFIQLINCSIRWLHIKAFNRNTKLAILSLANNLITKVLSSMFPQPAYYLWSLDLSYNKLKWLPGDLFKSMFSLRELKLDNNDFKDVSVSLFSPVWNTLNNLWLKGTNAICNPLCWEENLDKPWSQYFKCKFQDTPIPFSLYLESCPYVPNSE